MKRTILLLGLVMMFVLSGCRGSNVPTEPAPPTVAPTVPPATILDTVPDTEPETEPYTKPETEPETAPTGGFDYENLTLDDCVKTGYAQAGSYTDTLGNDWAYSYYLPEIILDCPGAREINEAVRTRFQTEGDTCIKEAEEGISLWLYRMDYTAARKGQILSVMIQAEYGGDYTDYAVYNLDLSTGRTMDRAAVLEAVSMTEEEFQEKVRGAAEAVFLKYYGKTAPLEEMEEAYSEQLENTRTQNADAPLFVNVEGELSAVVKIYALAGAEYYPECVEIQ